MKSSKNVNVSMILTKVSIFKDLLQIETISRIARTWRWLFVAIIEFLNLRFSESCACHHQFRHFLRNWRRERDDLLDICSFPLDCFFRKMPEDRKKIRSYFAGFPRVTFVQAFWNLINPNSFPKFNYPKKHYSQSTFCIFIFPLVLSCYNVHHTQTKKDMQIFI